METQQTPSWTNDPYYNPKIIEIPAHERVAWESNHRSNKRLEIPRIGAAVVWRDENWLVHDLSAERTAPDSVLLVLVSPEFEKYAIFVTTTEVGL